jgi:hypothetical protein
LLPVAPKQDVVERIVRELSIHELGDAMAALKKTAPTHPHPKAPDEPPGNLIAGTGAALVDKALDAGRKLVRRG